MLVCQSCVAPGLSLSHLVWIALISPCTATGNFPTVTRVLLAKIPAQDGKMTYVYDNYVFHYVVEGGICYLCMSDEMNKHRIPYAFLADVKDRFLAQYGHEAPLQAIAFAYNDEFSRILQDRMDFYNSPAADASVDNIGAVKSQIEDVKGVMVQNIEKVGAAKNIHPMETYSIRHMMPSTNILHILILQSHLCRYWNEAKKLNSWWTRRIA